MFAGVASYRIAIAQEETRGPLLKTLDGGAVAIDSAAVKELKAGLRGEFLIEGMPEYETSRQIWNAAIDRHPAIIIRCADIDDIVHAVRFAKRHNALLSVRAGGHNLRRVRGCRRRLDD